MKTKRKLLYFVAPPVLLLTAGALVVFFYLQFHKPVEMDLTSRGFSLSTIEITEGETIHFVNQSGITQVLCVGRDNACDKKRVSPKVLKNPGIRLKPGDSIDVLFDLFGTYAITSASIKGVNLTITVDAGG